MFTGIIETVGVVDRIEKQGTNLCFYINSPISSELKIDQSVSHNGVCLTVVEANAQSHAVVAIAETLQKEQGIEVARRTVAKYREAMNIPSSVIRRRQKRALVA